MLASSLFNFPSDLACVNRLLYDKGSFSDWLPRDAR